MNLHDVLRHLVRTNAYPDEEAKRQALLAVDAHENGFASAEDWQAELTRRAAEVGSGVEVAAGESEAEIIQRQAAELERLRALQLAHAGPAPAEAAATT
jgi:hypothetical protein